MTALQRGIEFLKWVLTNLKESAWQRWVPLKKNHCLFPKGNVYRMLIKSVWCRWLVLTWPLRGHTQVTALAALKLVLSVSNGFICWQLLITDNLRIFLYFQVPAGLEICNVLTWNEYVRGRSPSRKFLLYNEHWLIWSNSYTIVTFYCAEIRNQLVEQFKCLEQQSESRIQLLQDLQEFFRRKAEIELEYSRSLEKLAERFSSKIRSSREHQQFKWVSLPADAAGSPTFVLLV